VEGSKIFHGVAITLCVITGIFTACFILRACGNTGTDPGGSAIDTAGISRAQDLARSIGDRIGEAEKTVGASRVEIENGRVIIAESIPVIGDIGNGIDNITAGIRDAQGRVKRIETASRRIEQIIIEVRTGKEIVEGGGY
jgi:hypothetical protein